MKKLTLEHSEAVSAAKALLIYKADGNQPTKYKALLEEQIELLGEVYWWVLDSIYHPGLPYKTEEPTNGPANGG